MPQVDEGVMPSRSAPAPDHGGDARATAVLAVLGGVPADSVAERYGVSRGVLDGWVRAFVDAGRAGVSAAPASTATADLHRDRYLGSVAHELRSPLAMIQGWAELLTDVEDDPELRVQVVRGITAQVDRLRRLADDALDATGVALGRLELSLSPARLGDVVREVVGARSVRPAAVVVEDDVVVRVDHDRFGQIMDNLLENARKHGRGSPEIAVRQRGPFGEVVVSSPGQPIAQEVAQRMFEPFERGSTAAEGVGLGLYVCRSLVVAHGGQIGLRVSGHGNHFWVRLPIDVGMGEGIDPLRSANAEER